MAERLSARKIVTNMQPSPRVGAYNNRFCVNFRIRTVIILLPVTLVAYSYNSELKSVCCSAKLSCGILVQIVCLIYSPAYDLKQMPSPTASR